MIGSVLFTCWQLNVKNIPFLKFKRPQTCVNVAVSSAFIRKRCDLEIRPQPTRKTSRLRPDNSHQMTAGVSKGDGLRACVRVLLIHDKVLVNILCGGGLFFGGSSDGLERRSCS